ncbi:flagellar protein FlgN [Niallia sp. 03133]|uniref:flagellar protein FlgN n=1 Tax=Niallia sp. 03133 TaxID=3458060 RepID=UPI00404401EF
MNEQLIHSLEQLETLHRNLYERAEQKTEILKKGDMESLKEIMKDEQHFLVVIDKLEAKRIEAVKGLLPAAAEPKLQDILPLLTVSEQIRVTEAKSKLEAILIKLKDVNHLNQQLIYQSMQMLNVTLSLLRPTKRAYNYSNPAAKTNQKETPRLFNSEA